ncbi:VanZ family protein [Nocardioides piscis]|uniref:VanZ family protein n=1 Tax=Nocardioides piscis TaxID=2714938 RepID=A0A6G7YER8_9ACTN|nr:VanZ family protein [Nocardioides piscis]QIK75260.1 VanZ family protein [Nocardioides piscis]
MSPATRRLLALALVAYAVLLLVVLLNPSPAAPSTLVSKVADLGLRLDLPAVLLAGDRVEFGLNVLAFMPVSFLGSLLRPSIRVTTWTAAGFAGSFLIEVAQVLLPDRSATHSDVVANTLGAALGAVAAWVVSTVAARRQ